MPRAALCGHLSRLAVLNAVLIARASDVEGAVKTLES